MKQLLVAALLSITFCSTKAQVMYDTLPPYKKTNIIPAFKILQTDSTWFTKSELPKNRPIVIIYFSPDCGHCQLTAKELVKDMDKLKNIFFIMISYHTPDEIKKFAKDYKLNHFTNVKFGRDPAYFIPAFYRVKFTPFMAAYNKKGKLLQAWDQGTDPETLIKLFHQQ